MYQRAPFYCKWPLELPQSYTVSRNLEAGSFSSVQAIWNIDEKIQGWQDNKQLSKRIASSRHGESISEEQRKETIQYNVWYSFCLPSCFKKQPVSRGSREQNQRHLQARWNKTVVTDFFVEPGWGCGFVHVEGNCRSVTNRLCFVCCKEKPNLLHRLAHFLHINDSQIQNLASNLFFLNAFVLLVRPQCMCLIRIHQFQSVRADPSD